MSGLLGSVYVAIRGDTKPLSDSMHQAHRKVADSVTKMDAHWKKMERTIFSVGGAIAAVATGYGLQKLASGLIGTASAFEKFETQLVTITGSSQRAKASMDWVTEFGAKTPYQIDQVTNAFVKLQAYGLDATKWMGTLGDTASSMGKSLNDAVEMFADAITGEFERLKEFGVRAKTQGDKVTFSWVQNGQQMTQSAEKTQAGISKALGGVFDRFEGAMDRQSQTWEGMMSNMSDSWMVFQKDIMESGVFQALKDGLSEALDKIQELKEKGRLDVWAHDVAEGVVSAFQIMTAASDLFLTSITSIQRAWNVLIEKYTMGQAELAQKQVDYWTKRLESAKSIGAVGQEKYKQKIEESLLVLQEYQQQLIELQDVDVGLAERQERLNQLFESAEGYLKSAADATKKTTEETQKLTAALDRATIAAKKFDEAGRKKMLDNFMRMKKIQDKINDDDLRRAEENADYVIQQDERIAEKSAEAHKKAIAESERAYERFVVKAEDITAEFILDTWEDGFASAFDNLLDLFGRMLTQMIAMAAARAIVLPVMTQVFGDYAGVYAGGAPMAGGAGIPGGNLTQAGLGSWVGSSGVINQPMWTTQAPISGGGIPAGATVSQAGPTWGQGLGYAAAAYGLYNFGQGIAGGYREQPRGQAATSGALSGAMMGAPFGLPGIAIGAGIGAITGGLLGGGEANRKRSYLKYYTQVQADIENLYDPKTLKAYAKRVPDNFMEQVTAQVSSIIEASMAPWAELYGIFDEEYRKSVIKSFSAFRVDIESVSTDQEAWAKSIEQQIGNIAGNIERQMIATFTAAAEELGFATLEELTQASQLSGQLFANALTGAFQMAQTSSGWSDFETSLKDSVFSSVRDGLLNALISSELYEDKLRPIISGIAESIVRAGPDVMKLEELVTPFISDLEGQLSTLKDSFESAQAAVARVQQSVYGTQASVSITPSYAERQSPPWETRDNGGDVMANTPYIIGAGQTELFVPQTAGTVLSSADLKKLLGAQSSRPINITVMVGNEQFATYVANVSDGVRVEAEKQGIGDRPLYL